MKRVHALLVLFVLVLGQAACDKGATTSGPTNTAGAGTGPNTAGYKELIVGTWELVNQDPYGINGLPKGCLCEFTRDGTEIVTPRSGKEVRYTYEVTGDKLKQVGKQVAKQGGVDVVLTLTIRTLTNQDLVLVRDDKTELVFQKK